GAPPPRHRLCSCGRRGRRQWTRSEGQAPARRGVRSCAGRTAAGRTGGIGRASRAGDLRSWPWRRDRGDADPICLIRGTGEGGIGSEAVYRGGGGGAAESARRGAVGRQASPESVRQMALVVRKYGGTSVGSIERIHLVADQVERACKAGDQLVVVLSAMSGETDRLVRLAHEVAAQPDEREMDMLLSTGERVTIALLAMDLRARGIHARSFTGRQVGIITDGSHTKARIARVTADRIKEALQDGIVPIVAGFQGINERNDVTTLGRGGSDLTAVAL